MLAGAALAVVSNLLLEGIFSPGSNYSEGATKWPQNFTTWLLREIIDRGKVTMTRPKDLKTNRWRFYKTIHNLGFLCSLGSLYVFTILFSMVKFIKSVTMYLFHYVLNYSKNWSEIQNYLDQMKFCKSDIIINFKTTKVFSVYSSVWSPIF